LKGGFGLAIGWLMAAQVHRSLTGALQRPQVRWAQTSKWQRPHGGRTLQL